MSNGILAKQFCNKDFPVQVMKTRAGFYIGTCDEEGMPCSRESGYYPTQAAAQSALDGGSWTQRTQP
jgi:hypothetical protein